VDPLCAWAAQAVLTVTAVGHTAGINKYDIAYTAALVLVAVVALFAGAVSPVCVAAWPLLAFAIGTGLVAATTLGSSITRASGERLGGRMAIFLYRALYLQVLLWVAYAIVWGTAEGGKAATPTQEIITYTVLDILSKAVYSVLFVQSIHSAYTTGDWRNWFVGAPLDISLTHQS
jgi:bacteriorhodopsin